MIFVNNRVSFTFHSIDSLISYINTIYKDFSLDIENEGIYKFWTRTQFVSTITYSLTNGNSTIFVFTSAL